MIEVHDRAHLESLPDGSIIRWLRVPGDETSEAVGIVEIETEKGRHTDWSDKRAIYIRTAYGTPTGNTITCEMASITYPVNVIRYGSQQAIDPSDCQMGRPLEPLDLLPLIGQTGGTWAREKALECAVEMWSGDSGISTGSVLYTATAFEEWLDRDVEVSDREDEESIIAGLTADVGDAWSMFLVVRDRLAVSRAIAEHLYKTGWRRS